MDNQTPATNDAIYEQLIHMSGVLGEIKSQGKANADALTAHITKYETKAKEQDDRITTVEDSQKRMKWMAAGAGAIITALGWAVEVMVGMPGKR